MRLVVCHDAGGAELVSSWLRTQNPEGYCCVLGGPARAVFLRKLGIESALTLEDAIPASTSVLCGSSWQSKLELDAVRLARVRGVPSIVYLDHWVNFRARLEHGGRLQLPDAFWVADEWAFQLARSAFPQTPVLNVGNPYFDEVRTSAAGFRAPVTGSGRVNVLYVAEPVSEFGHMDLDSSAIGYDERDALEFFFRNLEALGQPVDRVVLRPHPSEPAGKYAWALEGRNVPIEMGGKRSLLEEIGDADVVAGAESMALVIGLLAARRVVSFIPPGGRACSLPFPDIQRIHGGGPVDGPATSESG
jgi:hypothetical protein